MEGRGGEKKQLRITGENNKGRKEIISNEKRRGRE